MNNEYDFYVGITLLATFLLMLSAVVLWGRKERENQIENERKYYIEDWKNIIDYFISKK